MSELSEDVTSIEELIDRLVAVETKIGDPTNRDVDTVLGAVQKPTYSLQAALETYVKLHKPELRDKNENQKRRWRNPLDLAVKNFVGVVGERSLDQITRDDALKFREWWIDSRIGQDVGSANTANKILMALRKIFRVVNDTHSLGLNNPSKVRTFLKQP